MGLSSQAGVVTTKKAVRLFFLGTGCTFFALISAGACAQELSRPFDMDGHKSIVVLEPREPSCQKAIAVVVNKLFCFQVTLRGSNDAWLKGLRLSRFDALMPGHHHGMITRPKITAKKSGEYLIEGVKLHMAGDWSVELKLEHGQATTQVAIPLKL